MIPWIIRWTVSLLYFPWGHLSYHMNEDSFWLIWGVDVCVCVLCFVSVYCCYRFVLFRPLFSCLPPPILLTYSHTLTSIVAHPPHAKRTNSLLPTQNALFKLTTHTHQHTSTSTNPPAHSAPPWRNPPNAKHSPRRNSGTINPNGAKASRAPKTLYQNPKYY